MARAGTWKAVAAGAGTFAVFGLVALATRKSPTKHATGLRIYPNRIALIGDSYAVGLGPELAKLFPTPTTFQYEGHVGMSANGWASCAACGTWLPDFKPDLVLVSLGVNGGNAQASADYQTVIRALHGIGARIVWIAPPAGVNAPFARAVIAALGVPVVPATTTPLGPDNLHPVSYAPWAGQVAQFVAAQAFP